MSIPERSHAELLWRRLLERLTLVDAASAAVLRRARVRRHRLEETERLIVALEWRAEDARATDGRRAGALLSARATCRASFELDLELWIESHRPLTVSKVGYA